MKRLILDASVATSWYTPAQSTLRASQLLKDFRSYDWRAPHCFLYELPNVLLVQERRGAIPAGATEKAMIQLAERVKVKVEPAPLEITRGLALKIARFHRISLFDGFYLHLALARNAALATRDRLLAAAAFREGLEVIDVREAA